MAPKRASNAGSPAKAKRARIGEREAIWTSERLIHAQHFTERVADSGALLSTRTSREVVMLSLREIALRKAVEGFQNVLAITKWDSVDGTQGSAVGTGSKQSSAVGWSRDRSQEASFTQEISDLTESVSLLPPKLFNRLLDLLLLSSPDTPMSSILLTKLFFIPGSLTAFSPSVTFPTSLLTSLTPCANHLTSLSLASYGGSLKDYEASRLVKACSNALQKVNFRGCVNVGNGTVTQLAQTCSLGLREVNLSLTAVGIPGLASLLGLARGIEVLKLANVDGLKDANVTTLLAKATLLAGNEPILSQLKNLKLRSTLITTLSIGKLLALCHRTLARLDISHTAVNSLDPLTSLLFPSARASEPIPPPSLWTLQKLNISSLRLSTATLLSLFLPLSRLPLSSRLVFDTLYMNSMPVVSTGYPGLNDKNFTRILECLEKIEGIERLGLSGNSSLGIAEDPMRRFFEGLGRRCRVLNLLLPLKLHHLQGLFGPSILAPLATDSSPPIIKIDILILSNAQLDSSASPVLSILTELRSLHLAGTKIEMSGLKRIMFGPHLPPIVSNSDEISVSGEGVEIVKPYVAKYPEEEPEEARNSTGCRKLEELNLTGCRGIPVGLRRRWFDAVKLGEV